MYKIGFLLQCTVLSFTKYCERQHLAAISTTCFECLVIIVVFIVMIVVMVGMMEVVFTFESNSRYLVVVVGVLVGDSGSNIAFHQ